MKLTFIFTDEKGGLLFMKCNTKKNDLDANELWEEATSCLTNARHDINDYDFKGAIRGWAEHYKPLEPFKL